MLTLFAALLNFNLSFAIELKSIAPSTELATKNADSINCAFSAKTTENKYLPLNSEFMKATDLSVSHDDGTKGIHVGVFDFLGFNFNLDTKKNLHITTESEEVKQKRLWKFSRLPATVTTRTEFSILHNSTPITIKEVKIVCKP